MKKCILLVLLALFVSMIAFACLVGPLRACSNELTCDKGYTCHNGFCINETTKQSIADGGGQE